MNEPKNTRRGLLKKSFGAAALFASAKVAHAAACTITPRQTSGPFIPNDFPFREPNEGAPYLNVADSNADLTTISGNVDSNGRPILAQGQILYVFGQVVDQSCTPVAGATVYLWQADINGHYNHQEDPNVHSADELDENFQYRASMTTDAQGRFQFKTIKPKYYPLDESGSVMRTAHLHFAVLHPKIQRLVTQTYFEGDALEDIARIRELNAQDIILAPQGKILPELKPLIIEFKPNFAFNDGPVGEVTFTVIRKV